MGPMHGAFIILVVIVFVAIAIGGILAGAKRQKALQQWTARLGWRYVHGNDESIEVRYGFDCLRRGRSRHAYNVCRGAWEERAAVAFDYRYVTGSGKNRQTHTFSAVIIESAVPLKSLLIRPEGFFDKIAQAVGFEDIDFESAEFSRRFCVKADDKRWAYDVIHQRTMDFLLSSPAFSIEFNRESVIVWRDRRLDVADFEAALGVAAGLLSRLPDYLVKQQLQR